MSTGDKQAVFLSYASQDTDAARRICDALRAAGVEVWFDQNELVGGDAWDAKIRRQIRECALFIPIVSANTQARLEGYFRIEWKLAAQRTHGMAAARAFLVPLVIDDTRDSDAHVPEEFLAVQWTRLPGGEASDTFCSRITRLLGSRSPPAGALARPVAGGEPAARTSSLRRAPTRATRLLAAAGVLALAAVAIGYSWKRAPSQPAAAAPAASEAARLVAKAWEQERWIQPGAGAGSGGTSARREFVAPPSAAAEKSVAVLPFVNLTGDPAQDAVCDGLTVEVLTALTNERDLRVPGSTSAFAFKGKNLPTPEIARALNVAQIVEGSVRKNGQQVRITVAVTRANDGFSETLGTLTEKFDDLFALQEKVARVVVEKLTQRTATARGAVAHTRNSAAYDAYLRARAAQIGGGGTTATIALFEEAIRLDPNDALAWARYAEMLVRAQRTGFDRSEQIERKSRQAAATALRLNPHLPEAHLATAAVRLVHDQDHAGAEQALDEVRRLRPNDPELPSARALLEAARGRWDDRLVALIGEAVALDPQNQAMLFELGAILSNMGRFAEADRIFTRTSAASNWSSGLVRNRAWNYLAWTGDLEGAQAILATMPEEFVWLEINAQALATLLALRGDFAAAIEQCEKLRANGRQTTSGPRSTQAASLTFQGRLEARRGNHSRAQELYAEAGRRIAQYERDFPNTHTGPLLRARLCASRGQKKEALAAADEAVQRAARTRNAGTIASARRSKAETLAALGEIASAVAELRAVHAMGYAFGHRLRVELEWEPLRGDPDFQLLMKEAEVRANAEPRPKT